ncbi:nickel pincer cofactor biosynthesis protein LarB [Anoxybacterium hadale]|uniref:Nickel pincer cofactor biosynthesis protein LarB n=1 Tax=Anoxybacterium hadale TaxID=3408580 RepID=A0ACD1ACN6_9FIRM|nr:nickel pincer cofactor biosynthesis protein LarB [Clostridiales bacterium]
MSNKHVMHILEEVKNGCLSIEDAFLKLKQSPFEDMGFVKIDHHRELRQGTSEVIYGEGKTARQIVEIASAMVKHGQKTIIITRLSSESAEYIGQYHTMYYNESGRIGVIGIFPKANGKGKIVIATGGTSDIPVAEEAAVTAEALGNQVTKLYDVGVAGIHRLFSHMDEIMSANVIIAIAGMEGALASVIGGIADCPVIAVPTSIGYGASFHGLAALLSMLNSCASGISVVNIDNGFGAGYLASMINHR